MKPYRLTKIVIPGWEKVNQRAYLVVDRDTGEALGRVHDQTLWNLYDPNGEDWVTVHSDEELDGKHYSTREAAADRLWRTPAPVTPGTDFPAINLKHAQNYSYAAN